MKKILFPTDFSASAKNAFQYTLQLAQQWEAQIDLISIFHLPMADAGSVPPEYVERILQEKKQQIASKMAAFVADADPKLLGKTRIDYGLFIAQEIVDAARTGAYDLIVMGTKGERNAVEKLMGSVTTHTMMQAHCPVLAIPAEARLGKIQQIAYATDFQPNEDQAIQQLMQVAQSLEAAVHLVHVAHQNKNLPQEPTLEGQYGDFAQFAIIASPSPQEGVDEFLQENHIDLLALYIPRRRLWEKLFHSSFSKRMVFHTKIPILAFSA